MPPAVGSPTDVVGTVSVSSEPELVVKNTPSSVAEPLVTALMSSWQPRQRTRGNRYVGVSSRFFTAMYPLRARSAACTRLANARTGPDELRRPCLAAVATRVGQGRLVHQRRLAGGSEPVGTVPAPATNVLGT